VQFLQSLEPQHIMLVAVEEVVQLLMAALQVD
jgi:hypothetical protein